MIDENTREPVGLLTLQATGDALVRRYRDRSASWATVTPVVLPGHDDQAGHRRRLAGGTDEVEQRRLLDHLGKRIDGLLRKAITQAGYSPLLAEHADLEWSRVGFWPGVEMASQYGVPDHLKRFPRFHVMIHWRDAQGKPVKVPGPVCLGSGRFTGLGLFGSLA